MPPLMAAEVVGESSEDDETLAYVKRLQPPPGAAREAGVRRGEVELLLTIPEVAKRLKVRPSLRWSKGQALTMEPATRIERSNQSSVRP